MAQFEPTIEQYLSFLSQKNNFLEPTEQIQIIQTHASVVALTDLYAYKLKKSVNFGFLDFTHLDQRYEACQDELSLNQRLSRGIYLDVLPIYWNGEFLSFKDNQGEIVNYVVKMLKMKDEGFLINLIKNDDFSLTKIDDLIVLLVNFYQSQKSSSEIIEWGKPEKISLSILENIQSMQKFEGFTLPSWASQLIYQNQRDFLDNNQNLFLERIQKNKILNCHGDLRAEHVYYADNQVQIFDCIEFNDSFRYIDQLNDIAFLMMDLEYRGRYDITFYFMQKIMAQLENKPVNDLLNFYKTYRAAVRGKVNSLKAQEHEVAAEIREESQQKAKKYYQWALKYIVFGSQPTILAILGGTATGKSTLSKAISKALPARHLNSDMIRKTTAGLDPYERTPADDLPTVYSEEMNQRTYEILFEKGLQTVKKEGMVILDATFRQKSLMEKLKQISQTENIRLILLQTTAPEEVIKVRLKAREHQKIVSDMRLDTYRPEAFDYEYAIEDYGDIALKVDTTGPLEDLIPGVMKRLIVMN